MTDRAHICTAAAALDDPGVRRETYPSWVCVGCGTAHGRRQPGEATWHHGTCGVCQAEEMVTEPRDFGHLRDGWQKGEKND